MSSGIGRRTGVHGVMRAAALLGIILTLLPALAVGAEEARIALVIGNADYADLGRLRNPPNDAQDIAAALRQIGFEVDLRIDADLETMEQAVVEFGRRLASNRGATGFFFYAGHGVESGGENYLIPARASIASESFLRTRSVATQAVLDEMQRSGSNLNVVVLDACRDNPFSWARSGSRGLAPVGYQPPGSIIAYATSAGSVAADGDGRNGTFTAELLKHIATPGIDINEMFRRTGQGVRNLTNGRQVPAVYNQFFDTAYLAAAPSGAAVPQAPAARPSITVEREYGSIRVSVETAGTVYLDGEELGRLDAGQSATIGEVPTGTRRLEVRYEDGERETITAAVRSGTAATARFSYVERVELRESIPTEFVQGGTFRMGSPSGGRDNERPVRSVTVSSFHMARTPTTFAQYDEFARATNRDLPNDRGWGRDERPVIGVNWHDAVAYANWLSEQDGLTPAYRISGTNVTWDRGANGWRLPTEAEWEFAARGGTQSRGYTYAGSNDVNAVAWYTENSNSRTQPVAGKQANELGLYDMSGNVWEWVWDWFGDYPSRAQTDPTGPSSGSLRVVRGGRWLNPESLARSANRYAGAPDDRYNHSGFRLVRPAVR